MLPNRSECFEPYTIKNLEANNVFQSLKTDNLRNINGSFSFVFFLPHQAA